MKSDFGNEDTHSGIIAWFARNHVAANLLMGFIILGGLFSALVIIQKQMFPQLELNSISIVASYPGAAPQDVEEGIAIRVEEALEQVQGIDRIITTSSRNRFSTYIRVQDDFEVQTVLDEVKIQIDSISSFPDGMERPVVAANKFRQEVVYIALYGDVSHRELKDLGEDIHREIQDIPQINVSDFFSGLGYEISLEVSKDKLREYNLSFQQIADAVRNFSTNRSAGQIKAEDGYINLRVENQAYRGEDFRSIPVRTLTDGSTIYLSDVATIVDGYEDGIQYSKFDGKNAVTLFVGASASQSITDVADIIHQYVENKNRSLPHGIVLDTWVDFTYYLNGRLNLMLKNMVYGGLLVFLVLAMFLRLRLAFWVMLGLPVAFLGTILLMPLGIVGITINVVSLFAFIMVLGIVVDDAIVIGESVGAEIEEKGQSIDNVIRGAKRVAVPATFGVLTTVAAFIPMLFATGPDAAFRLSIGWVVVLCLLFSLVESKLILPAHLASMKARTPNPKNPLHKFRSKVDAGLKYVISDLYRPGLDWALHYRYLVLAIFIAIIFVGVGLFQSGLVRFIGTPKIPHDFPIIDFTMEETAPESSTLDVATKIEEIIFQVEEDIIDEFGSGMVGEMQVFMHNRIRGQFTIKLVDPVLRPINTFELAKRWREAMPPLPGVKVLFINDSLFGGNGRDDGDISFKIEGHNYDELEIVAEKISRQLKLVEGVGDVNDSRKTDTKEVQFELNPVGLSLGLTTRNVASQMSSSLYGLEVQRILRNGEEIKVMLRYPEDQRNAVGHAQDILVQTPAGAELPLADIADLKLVDSVNDIRREDGKRTINVWASVNADIVSTSELYEAMYSTHFPKIKEQHPNVDINATGKFKREQESNKQQFRDWMFSLMLVYVLLALPLRSYLQPFIIIAVIPFGIIGSVVGHLILGIDLSALSISGIMATAGVVVNDSLVMVDYVNKHRKSGLPLVESVIQSGCRRFRPIILTSLTTFIGLIPIITETSMQAKIVIPMAVSLGFGVLFATFVTLLLVPCLYLISKDVKNVFVRKSRLTVEEASPNSV